MQDLNHQQLVGEVAALKHRADEREQVISRLAREVDALRRGASAAPVANPGGKPTNKAAPLSAAAFSGAADSLGPGADEQGPCGCLVTDAEGNCLRVNDTLSDWLQCSGDDVLGRPLQGLLAPQSRPAFRDALAALQVKNSLHGLECELLSPGGHTLPALLSAAVLRDARQQPVETYWAVLRRDPAAQQRAAEAFRRAERAMSIGTLAAGIAHEINNPIGAALLAAETALALRQQGDCDGVLETCLRNVIQSMERCGLVVRSILRFSHDEPAERSPRDVNDFIRGAWDLTRAYAERHSAQVKIDLEANLPLVSLNPFEIELVLVNLLRNAIESGERPVTVVVRSRQRGDQVRISIQDDGRGMSAEEQQRALLPFPAGGDRSHRLGLGLSTAHSIVQEHGGSIEIDSAPGSGATLTVVLPGIRQIAYIP